MIGKKFGSWTIVALNLKNKNISNPRSFICRCDCGLIAKKFLSDFDRKQVRGCRKCWTKSGVYVNDQFYKFENNTTAKAVKMIRLFENSNPQGNVNDYVQFVAKAFNANSDDIKKHLDAIKQLEARGQQEIIQQQEVQKVFDESDKAQAQWQAFVDELPTVIQDPVVCALISNALYKKLEKRLVIGISDKYNQFEDLYKSLSSSIELLSLKHLGVKDIHINFEPAYRHHLDRSI
jgi:hypothetical protein